MEELALRKEIEEKKRKERYHENESGLTDLGATQLLEMTLSVLIYICMFIYLCLSDSSLSGVRSSENSYVHILFMEARVIEIH